LNKGVPERRVRVDFVVRSGIRHIWFVHLMYQYYFS
jgi:hypothetical protein